MCGIAGMVTPGRPASPETLRRMVASMVHRGPDAEHSWIDDDVALGMRRLSIVDIDGGQQPLRNETGDVHVVFNGEIYNHEELRAGLETRGHRLDSRTDGAVVPHLYEEHGAQAFARLDGIFAIAVWDSRTRTLLLVRDHLGVKPLYVHERGGEIRFASEIKALLSDPVVPRELDLDALDEHLTYRFTPAPRTLLRGVSKIEPATVLSWRDGAVTREHYWRRGMSPPLSLGFRDAAAAFQGELRGAVHRQMMSDRPIGVMLSGGVDSAAIVALMAERSSQVKTFTVGWKDGGDGDETALARETAKLFGTEHHELIMDHEDFAAELPRVIEMLEEPVATGSAFGFQTVCGLARQHVPVLLSGQGADELLGGYWRYIGEWLAGRVLGLPRPIPQLVSPLARASTHVRSARIERGLRALRYPDVLERFMDIYAVFTPAGKAELYGERMRSTQGGRTAAAVELLRSQVSGADSLAQMMYVDVRLWLPDDLLLVGDKMSMAKSVEMRVPFLDYRLVDFVEALPSDYKVRRGRRKAIEKAALEPLLPREIVHRKERGFYTPIEQWLRAGMGAFARDVLLAEDGQSRQLFETSAIEALLARHQAGEFDHTRQIFTLLSFELWARRFLSA
jgi:asparagine synthase (glutamine-hydrolysing)